jgi:Arc/MetJ-type ribon-helix-helix transcriptional regulator
MNVEETPFMAIEITPQQEELVHVIFQTGGFGSESEVLSSALELLKQHRTLLEEVNAGVAALDAGDFSTYGDNDRAAFRSDMAAEAASRREAAGS